MAKFTIDISGYGGELTIGRLTEEQTENIKNFEGESLNDIIFDDEALGGYWSEIDDVYHNFNATDVFTLTITDENGEEIHRFTEEDIMYVDDSPIEVEFEDKYSEIEEPCLVCFSGEKGSFFEAELDLDEFDLSKLKIVIHEDCGLENCYTVGNMIGKVIYDGEELDNYGGNTDGKYFEVATNF